jgi:ubiquinone biosynthesis monooxygenase Coq7
MLPHSSLRLYSFADRLLMSFDQGLRTLSGNYPSSSRSNPANEHNTSELTTSEQRHAAGLMRVNHVGEICAQALYQGQAITARTDCLRQDMQMAAMEEFDHLAWCNERLTELNSRPSYLNPLWYAGSLSLGILAGLAGDRWNLGFLAETEQQVVRHLDKHLSELPSQDVKSLAIVHQMRIDEAKHAQQAQASGAADLPSPIKKLMQAMAKTMTIIAYRM